MVVPSDTEEEARAAAGVTLQQLPPEKGIAVTTLQELTHSLLFGMTISILNKRPSDDILIARLIDLFQGRAEVRLRNEPVEDGSVIKHFLLNDEEAVSVRFATAKLIQDYEKRGLTEQYLQGIVGKLEEFLAERQPELVAMTPVLAPSYRSEPLVLEPEQSLTKPKKVSRKKLDNGSDAE